jgi:hypothetical protein
MQVQKLTYLNFQDPFESYYAILGAILTLNWCWRDVSLTFELTT